MTTESSKVLTRDEQILFAREMDFKIKGVKAILDRVSFAIDSVFNTALDGDIRSDLAILFDGSKYASETLTSTIHDACIHAFKTDDDLFNEELEEREEKEYHANKLFHANWGKL